jgi:hypothetical protein
MPIDSDVWLAEYLREPRRVRRSVSRNLARRHNLAPRPEYTPASQPQCARHLRH